MSRVLLEGRAWLLPKLYAWCNRRELLITVLYRGRARDNAINPLKNQESHLGRCSTVGIQVWMALDLFILELICSQARSQFYKVAGSWSITMVLSGNCNSRV